MGKKDGYIKPRYCRKRGAGLVFQRNRNPCRYPTITGEPLYEGKERCPVHKRIGFGWLQNEEGKWFIGW